MGKKCPLKTVALVVDEKEKAIKSSQGRAQSWWRSLRAWEIRVECQWHGKVAWKSNEETTTKWKTSTNEDTQHQKWTATQKPPRGSPKGVFDFWFWKWLQN